METTARSLVPTPAITRPQPENRTYWLCSGMFFAVLGLVWTKSVFPIPAFSDAQWLTGLLVLSATASTLGSMSRVLPFQNVLLAAVVIAVMSGGAQTIGTLTGMPFGPYLYTPATDPRLIGVLPWAVPLMWIVVIFTSRNMAQLILRPWRKLRVYGFWMMGVTAGLSLLLDLGLEPFASRTERYWLWQRLDIPVTWDGTPLTNFVGWTVTTVLILPFTSPILINKKPGDPPQEYHPAIVWCALNLFFATSALNHDFQLGAGFSAVAATCAAVMAIRGARW